LSAYNQKTAAKNWVGRHKLRFPRGSTVYCWKFCHPTVGWVGGHDDDDWSLRKSEMEQRMEYCIHPAKLIEEVI